ncbi:MAG: hypothetical protein AAGM22_06365 [Acidobacteriota bacterium]
MFRNLKKRFNNLKAGEIGKTFRPEPFPGHLFRSALIGLAACAGLAGLVGLASAESRAEDHSPYLIYHNGISVPRCQVPLPDPDKTCEIYVENLEKDLFASLRGDGCLRATRLGPFKSTVIRYQIAEDQQSDLRFVGSKPPCKIPVTERSFCDPHPSPFEGVTCGQVNSTDLIPCDPCVQVEDIFCHANATATSVDLQIKNVNFCEQDLITLDYLIAVKATRDGLSRIGDVLYFRQYLVDPAVVQVPNCPEGCDKPPEASTVPTDP